MLSTIKSAVKSFANFARTRPETNQDAPESQPSVQRGELVKEKRPKHFEILKDPAVERVYHRNDVVRGEVVEHVRDGIMLKVPSGEVGLVLHSELDWSPKIGKKYFPIGSQHDVMVLNRKSVHRLYLSIKRPKFASYFEAAIPKYPVGMTLLGPIVARRDYGFFVNLMERVDVFIHKDKLDAFDRFQIGDLVEIRVTGYDMERLRIQGEMV